jgi:hypothetical protein
MLDELHQRMADFLAAHRVGVLSTAGSAGAWVIPVRYRPAPGDGLAVECLLPTWADAAYFLEQNPRVMLVILDTLSSSLPGGTGGGLRWLQLRGAAAIVGRPEWAGLLPTPPLAGQYRVARVTPTRLDLFDETRGWGARETVEFP